MEIRYFEDSDTLDLAFKELGPVARTVDGPNEDILLDFDDKGQLIGLTIEHASRNVPLEELLAERDKPRNVFLQLLDRLLGRNSSLHDSKQHELVQPMDSAGD